MSAWIARFLRCAGIIVVLAACSDDVPGPALIFPLDYATTYARVRECRRSMDHELNYVRIYADTTAAPIYMARMGFFPDGTTIVKEEYADSACTDLDSINAMRREPGFSPDGDDWHWQETDPALRVLSDGIVQRCATCHATCDERHDGTCSLP